MNEIAPNHRERLLDLKSQNVVENANPNRFPLDAPAKIVPEETLESSDTPASERELVEANLAAQRVGNPE